MIKGMETKYPTASNTDIANPAQDDALRLNQSQRLKDVAEALLQALEATPLPKDFVGLEKAAKAVIGLNKMLKGIYEIGAFVAAKANKAAAKTEPTKPEGKAPNPEAQKAAKSEALHSWMPKLNHKLERLAEKRRVALAAIPESVLLPP